MDVFNEVVDLSTGVDVYDVVDAHSEMDAFTGRGRLF